MSAIMCYCINCPDSDEENSSCLLKPGAQCFSAVEEQYNPDNKEWEPIYSAGCFPPEEQSILQCKGDLVPSLNRRMVRCCNFTDFCNKDLLPAYKPRNPISPPSFFFENIHIAPVIIFFLISFGIAVLCLLFLYLRFRKGSRKGLTELYSIKVQKCSNNLQDFISTSGSGVGKSLLVRRTIGRQVKKERLLGKGRFSEKWVVRRKDEKIVMKIFSTLEEDQWLRETKIYLTGLCHENVIGFIGADILKDGSRAIFTYYYEQGSLHDYLKDKCLNDAEFLALARSAACGVTALHIEILGTFKRPSIVHRNITSKNFLINHEKECVLSDFEVALINNETLDSKIDIKSGNPRYSAPEVIYETINIDSFESLKMADIYSLGLVLWEMCRRRITVAEDYALPFSHLLPEYPSVEDLKDMFATKTVIHEILGIPDSWDKEKNLKTVATIIKESVHDNPKARPTALRINKCLSALEHNEKENE